MTTINPGLPFAQRLRGRPNPDRRSASISWASHCFVTIEIDWMMAEELSAAIRPMRWAFLAVVCMPDCGGTA